MSRCSRWQLAPTIERAVTRQGLMGRWIYVHTRMALVEGKTRREKSAGHWSIMSAAHSLPRTIEGWKSAEQGGQ
jgi:hypothetical protein